LPLNLRGGFPCSFLSPDTNYFTNSNGFGFGFLNPTLYLEF
jgi:hypothetical protein